MNCQDLKFQRCTKKESETPGSSHSLLRRACVSLVSPLCSGGAVSTSSMADPASLPLAAVSVSASNSRHSTRKRSDTTQTDKAEAKRPRTRSQDTAASHNPSTEKLSSRRSKQRQQPADTPPESSITRNSLRNIANNKVHNNHFNSTLTLRNKAPSISPNRTEHIDVQRKQAHKRPQSLNSNSNSVESEETTEASTSVRKSFKVVASTSRWDVASTAKKPRTKVKSHLPVAESSIHKYPLRSQVRLSGPDSSDRSISDDQINFKATATQKKKHKVREVVNESHSCRYTNETCLIGEF